MANLNKVLLIGRLTRDPEFRSTQSGTSLAKFGLAVNRFFNVNGEMKEETCFLDITAWRHQAEKARNYLRKGTQAFIEGHLVLEQWESKEWQKRSKITVTANNIQLIDFSNREEGAGSQGREQYGSQSNMTAPAEPPREEQGGSFPEDEDGAQAPF